jgi:predicted SAM-dependent methyltransferase
MQSQLPKTLKGKVCLDIGCGQWVEKGFIGLDKDHYPGVEIIHDLEVFPWPIADGIVTICKAAHIVEHIKPWLQVKFMDECWRILEPGGRLLIATPYAGSHRFYQDPTHCCGWNEDTPGYFIQGAAYYAVYKPKPWKQEMLSFYIHGNLEISLLKLEE